MMIMRLFQSDSKLKAEKVSKEKKEEVEMCNEQNAVLNVLLFSRMTMHMYILCIAFLMCESQCLNTWMYAWKH